MPQYPLGSFNIFFELPKRVLPECEIRSEVNRSQSIVVLRCVGGQRVSLVKHPALQGVKGAWV